MYILYGLVINLVHQCLVIVELASHHQAFQDQMALGSDRLSQDRALAMDPLAVHLDLEVETTSPADLGS